MPQQRGVVIKVTTELEAGLPPVMGNASELREAATNLIFNAVDAMPEGGTIGVRTRSARSSSGLANHVVLEIADSGVGMDEETRRRCLEPFFTTKGERGTGLGLAMVYGAAQRHRAVLGIDSAPGKGTRVSLEFAAAPAQPAPDAAAAPGHTSKALRLLLVDDDPAVLKSTQMVLELDGHSIATADGGQAALEALKQARDTPFDVVVTDLGMPHVDGNQVAQKVKEFAPSTTVVLLTGWGRRMGEREPANVDYVLPKPLELDELRQIFAELPGRTA